MELWMHERFPDLLCLLIGSAKRIVECPPEPSIATRKPELDADVVSLEVQVRSSIPSKMARRTDEPIEVEFARLLMF